MSKIPQETLDAIKSAVKLEPIVAQHVALRRVGQQLRGLCPFHEERTPSFYVDPKRNTFKCYGCQAWGNVIDFVCKVEGRSFLEAVRSLAASAQISLPSLGQSDAAMAKESKLAQIRDRAFAINRTAMEFFQDTLQNAEYAKAARDYQSSRGIDDSLARLFCLGYAPAPTEHRWDALVQHLSQRGHDLKLAESMGLIVHNRRSGRHFDRYRGRWIFPILTPGKSVVGFSGRILPCHEQEEGPDKAPTAKYINSPETPVFKKSEMLFGLHAASLGMQARRRIILVEGNVDVLALHRAGFRETLAPLGTALTPPQCKRLRRLTETVVLCFDGDKAGKKAAWKALSLLLEEEIDVRIVALPEGQDPGSCDLERLRARLEQPPSAIPWFLRYLVSQGALQSMEAKDRAVQSTAKLLAKIPKNSVRQDYAQLAASIFAVPIRRLDAQIADLRTQRPGATGSMAPQSPPARLPAAQKALVALLFHFPDLGRHALAAQVLEHVQDPRLEPIAQALVDAARQDQSQPSQGELESLVPERWHSSLRDEIFKESYEGIPNPAAVLEEGLARARKDRIEHEIASIDARSVQARDMGDQDTLRSLQQQKIALRQAQAKLRDRARTL